jgi:hypothetical protein
MNCVRSRPSRWEEVSVTAARGRAPRCTKGLALPPVERLEHPWHRLALRVLEVGQALQHV